MFKQTDTLPQDTITNQKSESLTLAEWSRLKDFVKSSATNEAAATALGLKNRGTLARILIGGTGAPESISAIRKAFSTLA